MAQSLHWCRRKEEGWEIFVDTDFCNSFYHKIPKMYSFLRLTYVKQNMAN
jgi:hypothetical protein